MGWEEGETFSGELRGCKANESREKGDDLSQHKSNQSLLLLHLIKTEQHHYCFFSSFKQTLAASTPVKGYGECKIQRQYNGSNSERRLKASLSGESLTCLMISNKIVGT